MIAQEDVFIKECLERIEISRNYLVLVAGSMTQEYYSFKATLESMRVVEQHTCIPLARTQAVSFNR